MTAPTAFRHPARGLALLAGLAALCLAPAIAAAQSAAGQGPWTFRTRLVGAASSDGSEPAGYTVYSAITLDAGLARDFGRFAVEISARPESREVDYAAGGPAQRLGSLELLPLTATVQWRPVRRGSVRPYLGAGGTFTMAWEKSGVLDTMSVASRLDPALQAGLDVALGGSAFLNFDLRWNWYSADIRSGGSTFAKVKIDPTVLGIGVGFRF